MTDPGKIKAWRSAGINRLSIGIQSFYDADLRWMNRAHNSTQAAAAIRLAQAEGFDNISIDLIYGGPTLPDDHWQHNVAEAIRPLHEWAGTFERLWRNQLARVKERAENEMKK